MRGCFLGRMIELLELGLLKGCFMVYLYYVYSIFILYLLYIYGMLWVAGGLLGGLGCFWGGDKEKAKNFWGILRLG